MRGFDEGPRPKTLGRSAAYVNQRQWPGMWQLGRAKGPTCRHLSESDSDDVRYAPPAASKRAIPSRLHDSVSSHLRSRADEFLCRLADMIPEAAPQQPSQRHD